MKTKYNYSLVGVLTLTFFFLTLTTVMAQKKTNKQLKNEAKLEKQKQISLMVDSKEFVFHPISVTPQTGRNLNINDGSYSMEFHPDLIKSYLPFFGRGFSGTPYGGGNGMDFEGVPSEYTIKKTKKSYSITIKVKTSSENYSIALNVFFEGNAFLTVNSNNSSSISYNGTIEAFQKK